MDLSINIGDKNVKKEVMVTLLQRREWVQCPPYTSMNTGLTQNEEVERARKEIKL